VRGRSNEWTAELPGAFATIFIRKSPESELGTYEFRIRLQPELTRLGRPGLMYGGWTRSEQAEESRLPNALRSHLLAHIADRIESDVLRSLIGEPSNAEQARRELAQIRLHAIASFGRLEYRAIAADKVIVRKPLVSAVREALDGLGEEHAVPIERAKFDIKRTFQLLASEDVTARVAAIYALGGFAASVSDPSGVVRRLTAHLPSRRPGRYGRKARSPESQAVASALSGLHHSGDAIDLEGKDLHGLVFADAHLDGFRLRGADLSETVLHGVSLKSADLSGTDLRNAQLLDVDLSGATYDRNTRWPENFDPEAFGARRAR
jgi:hypothetical protein